MIGKLADDIEELVRQCEAYHEALDRMFAMMIDKTKNEQPHCFYPTESGQPWAAMRSGHALIERYRNPRRLADSEAASFEKALRKSSRRLRVVCPPKQ